MGKTQDAKDLVKQSDVGDVAPRGPGPGKSTQPQGPTGDPYVDHGAVCDGQKGGDCFLTDAQRNRLVTQFQGRVHTAHVNYVAAATALHVEKLIQKPDTDMHWLASMLLDLVVGHIAGKIATTLVNFKNAAKLDAAVKALDVRQFDVYDSADVESLDLSSFSKPSIAQRARSGLLNLKEETVKTGVKEAVNGAKKGLLAARVQQSTDDHNAQKTQNLSYIEQLMDAAGLGFSKLSEQTPAFATDAELVALFHAMAPENHRLGDYKEAIAAKVDRFKKSGVDKIGAHYADRAAVSLDGDDIHEPKGQSIDVVRHTRLAWREYLSGYPKDLIYEHQDGERTPGVIELGEPGMGGGTSKFGPRHAITKEAEVGNSVPHEFHEQALLKHAEVWKSEPRTFVYDDSNFLHDPTRAQKAQQAKAKAARSKGHLIDSVTSQYQQAQENSKGSFIDRVNGNFQSAQQKAGEPKSMFAGMTAQWQDIQDKHDDKK